MREVLAFRAVRRSWSSWRKILSGTLRLARHNCSSAAVSLSAFSGAYDEGFSKLSYRVVGPWPWIPADMERV